MLNITTKSFPIGTKRKKGHDSKPFQGCHCSTERCRKLGEGAGEEEEERVLMERQTVALRVGAGEVEVGAEAGVEALKLLIKR